MLVVLGHLLYARLSRDNEVSFVYTCTFMYLLKQLYSPVQTVPNGTFFLLVSALFANLPAGPYTRVGV